MTGPKVLVACANSELRVRCFDRVSSLGVRVDAVGDQRGLDRRLGKDEYALILHDGALQISKELADVSHHVEVGSDLEIELEERVRIILEVPERIPEEEEELPEGDLPPWKKQQGRNW